MKLDPLCHHLREQLEDGVTKLEERLNECNPSSPRKTRRRYSSSEPQERKLSKKLMSSSAEEREDSGCAIEQRIASEKRKSSSLKESQSEMISAEATKQGSQAICIAVIRKAIKQPK
jgi:hypothetical protein